MVGGGGGGKVVQMGVGYRYEDGGDEEVGY